MYGFACRRIPVILYNLRSLSGSGASRTLDFGRLMVFDIVAATNAESAHPRPLYWLRQIRNDSHTSVLRMRRLPGSSAAATGCGRRLRRTRCCLMPLRTLSLRNADPEAYADRTPAGDGSLAAFRADGGRSARLLERGNIDGAERNLSGQPTRAWATAHTPTPTITSPTPR